MFSEQVVMFLLSDVVMDAEVESVMASSQDQREEELQVCPFIDCCFLQQGTRFTTKRSGCYMLIPSWL